MLIIPTRSKKVGHIPLPWAVGYNILGFLICIDWQVDLHSKTSTCICWSVITTGCSGHCWVQRALITSSIGTPTPRRGWASGETSRYPWCSMLPTSSTTPLMHQAWLSPVLLTSQLDAPLSRPHIQSSMLQVTVMEQMVLFDPQGHPGPLAFIFL